MNRHLLHAFLAASIFVLTACDDSMRASYATAAAARADGGVARGWLPDELPDSAFSISESHNLDTNTGEGSFRFAASDADSFRAKLTPASLQRDGYTFYVVPKFVLAVSASPLNRRLEFLHPNEHTLRMSTKQIVQDLLQKLPENVSLHDVAQEIEFVAGVRQGLAEIDRGERIPIEDIERDLPSWVIR